MLERSVVRIGKLAGWLIILSLLLLLSAQSATLPTIARASCQRDYTSKVVLVQVGSILTEGSQNTNASTMTSCDMPRAISSACLVSAL